MELDLEDQINLFLINYRHICMTSDGKFPSEKVFSYVPKTLLDLVNPKKSFKHQLVTPPAPPPDDTLLPKLDPKVDPLDSLTAGDVVWYKNHNPRDKFRWLKATFIKRVSRNLFQVEIGSARPTAHRIQLRVSKDTECMRPNILLSVPGPEASTINTDNEGTREVPGELERMKRKRKHVALHDSSVAPRRSKRKRTIKTNSDFVYS